MTNNGWLSKLCQYTSSAGNGLLLCICTIYSCM